MQRSLYTDSFFCLIYLLIFIWFGLYLNRTNGISDGFCCEKNTANIFLLNTNRTCKCAAPALSRVRYWIISISAAASGNACKSVQNPFASKRKGQKKSVLLTIIFPRQYNTCVLFPSFFLVFKLSSYSVEVNSFYLGEAIRKARLAQNLTQDELGKRVGIQRSQICRLESGRTNITIPVMSRVFQALGIATATFDLGVAGKIALWQRYFLKNIPI